jgi:hypothetical protein
MAYTTARYSRMCVVEGCPKNAQGPTRKCIAHGGGRRCVVEGCAKSAQVRLYCGSIGSTVDL